jgi:hypothetical protein
MDTQNTHQKQYFITSKIGCLYFAYPADASLFLENSMLCGGGSIWNQLIQRSVSTYLAST